MNKIGFSQLKGLFPADYSSQLFSKHCRKGEEILAKLIKNKEAGRISGKSSPKNYTTLGKKYGKLPQKGKPPAETITNIIKDFTREVPLWRSPNLQHNVGAAVNIAASAMYALAMDLNIYNINSGLAGTALAAERAVARILANLANVNEEKSHGIFTFGGTATNLYALKVAISKVCPHAVLSGIPKNIRFLITEDAHFSHGVSANWLGLGTKKLIVTPANEDRRSNLEEAENKAKDILDKGNILAGIVINGGTTYDHAVDDIAGFANLRKRLIKEYSLDYVPHIHVDAVIGWAWLMFKGYDFKKNPLSLTQGALGKIESQYRRVSKIHLADSWGVDFHKGVGGCPIPCSVIMMNNKQDFLLLSKKDDPLMVTHQLAEEFSFDSPSDYTLETSRPGGAPLAALAALHTLGQEGYRAYLGNLIEMVGLFRKSIQEIPNAILINPYSLGYVSMVAFLPPELDWQLTDEQKFPHLTKTAPPEAISQINEYMKAFFKWDSETRMSNCSGIVYSYSSSYIKTGCGSKLSALKFYPVSPHLNEAYIKEAVKTLKRQKETFDTKIWPCKKNGK